MATKSVPQAVVQLYINGEGPKFEFTADLKGWDPNRLDLDSILKTYGLKSLYAFSVISGRGMELVPDRRNGLSKTTYSGKVGTVVRLDGEPLPSRYKLWSPTVMTLGATLFTFIVAAGFVSMDAKRMDNVRKLRKEGPSWPFILAGSLLIAIYVWRCWRASLLRWYK